MCGGPVSLRQRRVKVSVGPARATRNPGRHGNQPAAAYEVVRESNPSPSVALGALKQHHFVVTLTVTLLFAVFGSDCGSAVATEAVFTICWGALDATTVSVIVA